MKNKKKKHLRKKNVVETSGFINKLQNCTSLKVKYMNSYHPIPKAILQQAKLFAINSTNVDYDVFTEGNPLPSNKRDAQIQHAFEDYLEGYLESIMPLGNPTYAKASAAYDVMYKHFSSVKDKAGKYVRTLSGWFSSQRDEDDAKRIMKSGATKIAQTYLGGALKLDLKEDKDALQKDLELSKQIDEYKEKYGRDLTDAEIEERKQVIKRSGFVIPVGAGKAEQHKVIVNRTIRNIVTLWIAQLTSEVLNLKGEEVRTAIAKRIEGLDYLELTGDELRAGLLTDIRENLEKQLESLDLVATLKRPSAIVEKK